MKWIRFVVKMKEVHQNRFVPHAGQMVKFADMNSIVGKRIL